jgi:hypothetical protein
MQVHKNCNLCGTGSEDTAVFTCNYAKGELNICLGCLAEGILETIGQNKQKTSPQPAMKAQDINPIVFDLSIPDEVFGFACEGCGSVMFADTFPVQCECCQHINNQTVVQKNK